MTRIASAQITKSKNDTKHYKDQEIAQRSDEQNSATDRMNNKDKIFCN